MTKRLQAIEDRAKALGWEWYYGGSSDWSFDTPFEHYTFNEKAPDWPQAAERLLALYELGPAVEVKGVPYQREDSPEMGMKLEVNLEELKSACKRVKAPGTYKLVPVEVNDD